MKRLFPSLSKTVLVAGLILFIQLYAFSTLGQASYVAASFTQSKTAYTPGAGKNRLIVVAVHGELAAGIGTITSVTWGGQALTAIATQTAPAVTPTNRLSLYYLNEAGISAARGACGYNFVVTWSTAPTTEVFQAFTLKDVDQTTPIPAGTSTGNATNFGSTVTLPNLTTAGANDIVIYASGSNNNRTHTPPAGYTEITEQAIATGVVASMASAYKQITTTGNEGPVATWTTPVTQLLIAGVVFNGVAAQSNNITYYSRASGDWDLNTTWSLSADGSSGALPAGVWPTRTDNVVISASHTVAVDATDDNKFCGISPDGLGRTNVGPFTSSNTAMFYQTGDLLIAGTLQITNGVMIMIENYTRITSTGNFNPQSNIVNLEYLQADASSTFFIQDDMVLAGASTTIINTSSVTSDDLIISFTAATLCGTGVSTLTNGSGSVITYVNGATVAQICSEFQVTCTGVGCGGTFPVTGTGATIFGNTGPGGVGNRDYNRLWLKANDITQANNTALATWADASGNSLSAANATATEQPRFFTAAGPNGYPFITFDGSTDNLSLGAPAGLNFTPGTHRWSFVGVYRAPTNGLSSVVADRTPNQGTILSKAYSGGAQQRNYQYQIDDINGTQSTFNSYIGNDLTPSGTVVINNSTWHTSTHTNSTTQKSSWTNQTANFAGQPVAIAAGADAATQVLIGARRGAGPADGNEGFWFTGDIAELAMWSGELNTAQRIIIDNYLSAKYGLTLSANNVYTMDDLGSGNFDHEVAGIGQANDGTNHKDAKGSIVRMWNPSNLGNNEFLMWGHDGTAFYFSTATGTDGTIIEERLGRIWRADKSGDVGTVNISFDISQLGTPLGSNLRLLIDRDGDGFQDNDVTPISGVFAGNEVVFSNVNFVDGDRFTLGNTDITDPLPVGLIGLKATPENSTVRLNWATATEKDNHYFTVERSKDAKTWEFVSQVNGAGTSLEKKNYELIDDGPFQGVSYYRLSQTDFDATMTHLDVVRVVVDEERPVVLYPNPFKDSFRLDGETALDPRNVRMLNSSGVQVSCRVTQDWNELVIDGSDLVPGLYILQVMDGTVMKTVKVIKSAR